jgi:uncharacterized protein YndB with AHSA1/START domain
MQYETSTTTTADPARLWAVLHDVERWPQWVEAYQEVRRAESGELALGDTAYVKQHGLAGGDWTVTELEPGRVFAWESRQPGVRMVGRHEITPVATGSRLSLSFEMSGWLAGPLGALLGRKVRTYVDLECARLSEVAAEPTAA